MRLWHKVKLHGVGQSQPRPLPGQLRGSYGSSEANDEQEQWEIVSQSSAPVIVEDIEREADTSEIETPLDSGLHGLFIFADKGENDIGIVDIIAIHGLNGHYQNTWTAFPKPGSKCNWLQDLLPKQVPNARIMSYGYNSSIQFSKSTAGIGDFAGELLEELLSYRRTAAEKARPIIFICHSLGGIVFKKALIRARERDRYTELLKKIRGVVFFGTPHSGSGVASWADILANVLKTASLRTSTNRGLIKDLKTTSEVLEDISRSFVDRSKALKIVSFYESDTMELINCKIVSEKSAVLRVPNEVSIMMNGNHRSMCRFSDSPADEKRYRIVWTNIKAIVDELLNTEVTHITRLSKKEQALCMKRISQVNYESFRNRNPERVPMTCEWFVQHPKYKTWRNKEESSLLWVSADPGCGKSVMAKFLVDHLRHTKSEAGIPELVCHFFFKDDNDAQRNSVVCLSALIHQIMKDDQNLLRHVFPIFESKGTSNQLDFNNLWRILFDVSQDQEATNLICILDGLDECEKRSQLQILNSLRSFYSHPVTFLARRPFTKFIIFSRPENSIKSLFSSLTEIRLRGEDETEAISKDVERVIQHNIDELGMQGLPSRLLASFQTKLVNGADRTFLWTTLMIQLLKEASMDGVSQEDLEMLLESRNLYVLYNHLLQKSVDKPKARKLLQIVLAATRPLTLDEVNIAVSISSRHSSLAELDGALKYPCENYIKGLCGHFIRIIKSKVYLVHQTAKEFLLQQDDAHQDNTSQDSVPGMLQASSSQWEWQHSLSMRASEHLLLETCMQYLTLLGGKIELEETLSSSTTRKHYLEVSRIYHFLEYSSTHWPIHFRRTGQGISLHLVEEAVKLCDPKFPGFSLWLMAHNYHADRFKALPPQEIQLRIATILDLDALVKHLFDIYSIKLFSLTSPDKHGQRALHLTYQNSSSAIARLLLDHGARTEDKDEKQQTPLHFVASGGSVNVASILIEYEADIEAKDKRCQTPLHLAVISNHLKMVELLLKHGSVAETYDKDKRTPLLDAVSMGKNSAIVKQLIEHGADVNVRDDGQRTTLHLAALSGDLDTIKGILTVKPDITLQDVNGDTALHVLRRQRTLDLREASARSSLLPQLKGSSPFTESSVSPRR